MQNKSPVTTESFSPSPVHATTATDKKRSSSSGVSELSDAGDGNTIVSSVGTSNLPLTASDHSIASTSGGTPPPAPCDQRSEEAMVDCNHEQQEHYYYNNSGEYHQQQQQQGEPQQYGDGYSYDPYQQQQQQQQYQQQPEEQQHYYYSGPSNHFQPPPAVLCYCCGTKAVVFGSDFCSRRCQWLCSKQCPHCGKAKMENGFLYCSRHCANQSAQANWCSYCGVCQNDISGACSNVQCRGASSQLVLPSHGPSSGGVSFPSSQPSVIPQLALGGKGGNGRHQSKMECRVLNSSEVSRSGLPAVFNSLFSNGFGSRIVTAVKLTACAPQRKRYLSYRSIVENQMSAMGVTKYGHGGEGNEQRRYFGLPLQCSLGGGTTAAGPTAPSAIGTGGGAQHPVVNLRTCQDPSCHVCQMMSRGFDMTSFRAASHYCNTTVTAASQYLEPSQQTNLKAIVVARVVVGNPEVHVVDPSNPPMVQPPADPLTNHSLIFTTSSNMNETAYDGTYIFSDEAVDPQYLVLFE